MAVHRHQVSVPRLAIGANGGSVQAAFPTVLQTVAAAVAAKRAMLLSILSAAEAVTAVGRAAL
jgi:hypothetical protein